MHSSIDFFGLSFLLKDIEEIKYTFCIQKSDLTADNGDASYLSVTAEPAKSDINIDNNTDIKVAYDIIGEQCEKGDVNADGNINLTDIMLGLKHLSRKEILTGSAFAAADVDEDGNVTLVDLMRIMNYVSKKSDKL